MIVRPNPGPNFSAANYAEKTARWKKLWPEITVLPADARRPLGATPGLGYLTTPEINPALRRGGLMSFFR